VADLQINLSQLDDETKANSSRQQTQLTSHEAALNYINETEPPLLTILAWIPT